ncbi:MAG: hypothetical protein M0Q95_17155 [Porticoccaceae bacterium]|nr:hypothetical protein [Porticoccaceae bacterium]
MENHEAVRKELVAIAQGNGGVILPRSVVEAAKDRKSPLHSWFCWDDSEAAERYRIIQARELIRSVKVEIGDQTPREVRAFVSLTPDRADGGGYRLAQEVVSDAQLYQQMLRDALAELERFEQKYSRIKELQYVFREARRVTKTRKAA